MNQSLEKFAVQMATLLGTSWAFLVACLIFASWLAMAIFTHAENGRLFIVELTGLFIFVHLFIVQRNNNKDIRAVHVKLDEIIATLDGANNKLIKAETAPESVVNDLRDAYAELASSVDHPTKPMSLPESQLENEKHKRSA